MPHRMSETIHALAVAQPGDEHRTAAQIEASAKIAECDRKLAQYRAALDQGASPAAVAGWITEAEAEKARYEASLWQVPRAHKRDRTRDQVRRRQARRDRARTR